MTVSVPKVPVILPGEEETSWVDLKDQLNCNRILFLCQELDTEISNDLMGLMLYLGMEDYTQDLYLFLNSPVGKILNGMAIHIEKAKHLRFNLIFLWLVLIGTSPLCI
uniref:ATP-dependent Clp protease proteolytic subunit n=1 Tax=Rhipsalis teres TaxID=169218 RepID=A0A894JQQ8_9CARY|nr:truncated clp protease proteolytic subunit [Rhipsalis teres]QRV60112.1 truncated clp protease proteolytic subunit [Rhipsalis teres]